MKSSVLKSLLPSVLMLVTGCYDSNAKPISNEEMTDLITQSVDRNVARPFGYEAKGWRAKDPSAREGWFVMGLSLDSRATLRAFPNAANFNHIAINTREWERAARDRGISVSTFVDRYFSNDIHLTADEANRLYRGVLFTGNNAYTDQFGNLYDEAGATQKDLETLDALEEESTLRETGRKIADEFLLSEEQSFRLARISSEWQTIAKSRQMTVKDVEAFTQDVAGIDLSSIRSATQRAAEGNTADLENLIQKAAENLDTTPENMKAILASFIKN